MKEKWFNDFKLLSFWDYLAAGICAAGFLFWVILTHYKYICFEYFDWDLAMYAHTMWNLAHGSCETSLLGMNFMANHAQFIAFLLVPIYFIFEHPLTLVTLKILSFFVGGFLLYVIAKRSVNSLVGIFLLVMYLIYPPNIFMLIREFHFESLAIAFIFILYYCFTNNRVNGFWIAALILMSIKENMPFIVLFFGLFGLFAKKDKWFWGVLPIVVAGAFIYWDIFIVIPHFREGFGIPKHLYLNNYKAVTEIVTKVPVSSKPLERLNPIIELLLRKRSLVYLDDLLNPLAYSPLLSPQILFLALPLFMQNLLSKAGNQTQIYFHYAATLGPFLFLACVNTFRWLGRLKWFGVLFTLALAGWIGYLSFTPFSWTAKFLNEEIKNWPDRMDVVRLRMSKDFSSSAPTVASFSFLSELSNRKELYNLFNVYRGWNSFRGEAFYLPESVEYALVDFGDRFLLRDLLKKNQQVSDKLREFFLSGRWSVKHAAEEIVLFEKRISGSRQVPLLEISQSPFVSENTARLDIQVSPEIVLMGIKSAPLKDLGEYQLLPMTFYWYCAKPPGKNLAIVIDVYREETFVFESKRNIGYGIKPTKEWKKGEYIKENFWMMWPNVPPSEYSLKARVIGSEDRLQLSLPFRSEKKITVYNTFDLGKVWIDQ